MVPQPPKFLTHEDCREAICCCCGVKTAKKRISAKEELLVKEHAKKEYNSKIESYPAGLCSNCRRRLFDCAKAKAKKVEQQNKLAEKKASLFDHTNSTMLAMLETGQLSDYKLLCEEEVLDDHKMIHAARSPYFVELTMKNLEQCVITNVDMETLKLLVKFTT